jgi:predicted glutamine amidotransferase
LEHEPDRDINEIVEEMADDLMDLPYSMSALSQSNRDGWGLVGFPGNGGDPWVRRGADPAFLDRLFPSAVAMLEGLRPTTALCHLRICTSGLCHIPDPHPFEREKNGCHWFLAHNGSIDKNVLLGLIRPDYLAANPPANGHNPTEWIDSELYFLYVLQTCEDHGWNVGSALREVVCTLRGRLPVGARYLNILFTNGETLWAYREGFSLYFLHGFDAGVPFTAVASRYPNEDQGDWTSMEDGELLTAGPDGPPRVESIDEGLHPTAVTGPRGSPVTGPGLSSYPNPCNRGSMIRCCLPAAGSIHLEIFDALGNRVADVASGRYAAGYHDFIWDGRDGRGCQVASGVYFVLLEYGRTLTRGKLTLLR